MVGDVRISYDVKVTGVDFGVMRCVDLCRAWTGAGAGAVVELTGMGIEELMLFWACSYGFCRTAGEHSMTRTSRRSM